MEVKRSEGPEEEEGGSEEGSERQSGIRVRGKHARGLRFGGRTDWEGGRQGVLEGREEGGGVKWAEILKRRVTAWKDGVTFCV